MAKFVVRRATVDDLPRLVELWTAQRDIETQLDPRLGLLARDDMASRLQVGLQDDAKASVVFVACLDDVILGFTWGKFAAVGIVAALVVDAHDGRGGVGSVLLDAAVDWLRDMGAQHLVIEDVPRHVAVQHAFWRAKGAGVIRETLYLPIRQNGDDA
jgi:GNAT superfamily N-acetyltransferase